MPRDYKHRVGRKQRKTLSPWIGVAAGLLIGLFVAFLVYIKLQAEPKKPVYSMETLPPPAVATTQEDVQEVSKDEPEATPAPPKPRFDFYTLLPEIEVVVPDEEIEQSRKPAPAPVAATGNGSRQTGCKYTTARRHSSAQTCSGEAGTQASAGRHGYVLPAGRLFQ